MRLIPEWKRVLYLSISFWMQVAGLLVLIIPELRYAYTGEDYDPYLAWWLGVMFLFAGLIGRLFQQTNSKLREWARIIGVVILLVLISILFAGRVHAEPVTEQETLSIAVPFIASEEGERTSSYLDIVGVPTICFGSTKNVKLGMTYTHDECMSLLYEEVADYRLRLHSFFTIATISYRLNAPRDAAYTSTAFNVGVSGIGKSTATKRLNSGNIIGGCQALTWWNKAGGRVIRGLVARRKREEALCLIGAEN